MQLLSVFTNVFNSIVNFIRHFSLGFTLFLIFALLILGILALRKAIKVNYNPKDLKKINLTWFLLVLIIFALVAFISIIYF